MQEGGYEIRCARCVGGGADVRGFHGECDEGGAGRKVSVWGKGQVGDKTVGVMGAQEEKVYGEEQRVALGRNKLFLVDVNTMDGFPVG